MFRGSQVNLLGLQGRRRVVQTGVEVIGRDARIAVDDLFVRPAVGQQFDEKLDCQARAFDDRFADEHARVEFDSRSPRRSFSKPAPDV